MRTSVAVVILIILSTSCVLVQTACVFNSRIVSVNETDPNNTQILQFRKDATDSVSFQVFRPSDSQELIQRLRNSFRLVYIENDTNVVLVTSAVLDLEVFHLDFRADITTTVLNIYCNGTGGSNTPTEITIVVRPVNEFSPEFLQGPFSLSLNESTAVGTSVFGLKNRIQDNDFGEVENFQFDIEPYRITDIDGRAFFNIPTKTKGDIVVSKVFDYDNSDYRHNMTLNLSVTDGGGLKSFTQLTVHILDVDDQPPYFMFPNCPPPCPAPPFLAIIELDSTGDIQVLPGPLRGNDSDTLGTKLLYSIISGNDKKMFSIDESAGKVTQLMSVNQVGSPAAEFRLIIKVRKDLPVDLSAIAVLTVKVRERMPNDTGLPPPHEKSAAGSGNTSDFLIPMIVLGILLAIVIGALIVVFILFRRKKNEMSVKPTDDKSEPQTEEEELHTEGEEFAGKADSTEKLVFGNKTTLGIMTDMPPTPVGRANLLAPLPMKDTGTETDGKKKKRARKRNKNKEPEIFDGTREYNMGLDPEFFDSTDKSKVKRSQRSKKADNSHPITVPNDSTPEEGSLYS